MQHANSDSSNDPVSNPSHYEGNDGISCIDCIRAGMSEKEYIGYLRGNVIKYLWRFDRKGNPKQDLAKAEQYLSMLMDAVDAAGSTVKFYAKDDHSKPYFKTKVNYDIDFDKLVEYVKGHDPE